MEQFELRFQPTGVVTGRGVDVVGVFVIEGKFDRTTGAIDFVKQYLGRHRVRYSGQPDGEGHIIGTWVTGGVSGPFSLQPVVGGELPIVEITR